MGLRRLFNGNQSIRNILICLIVVLILPMLNNNTSIFLYSQKSKKEEYKVIIEKHKFELRLYKGNKVIKKYPVAIGKNPGDKQRVGDMRTPEGNFYISNIHDSRKWIYDFKDGKGPVKGAYGPYFLRLYTGAERTKSGKAWKGIGIHGTHDPASIGTMASEGCIRMHNEDLLELKKYVKIGTPVIILP